MGVPPARVIKEEAAASRDKACCQFLITVENTKNTGVLAQKQKPRDSLTIRTEEKDDE
jgi:hypothetical protein